MAGSSLLALIDDIAALLDDIAILSKVAAKKTSGVLGDDLALNAQQVAGVRAERELPVVYAVAKGSMLNKAILVPAALLISVFIPALITPLLILGGLFLCFEGVEKLHHSLSHAHKDDQAAHKQEHLEAIADSNVDMRELEAQKIKGAIRTDFILSAEIIVIALGTVKDQDLLTQGLVLSTIAILMTLGVYSLVAAIVKLDDAGLYLLNKGQADNGSAWQTLLGKGLLAFAPWLMKTLSVVGTAAMFLVGGGILVHGVPMLAGFSHHLPELLTGLGISLGLLHSIASLLFDLVMGVLSGSVILLLVLFWQKIKLKQA